MTFLGTILVAGGVLLLVALAIGIYITVSMNVHASREDVVVSMRCVADDEVEFMRAFNGAAGRHAHDGNAVTVFQNGAEIFPPMLEAIAAARSSVHFATFIYWGGEVPETFAAALIAAARRGVTVRAVLDSDGSAKVPKWWIATCHSATTGSPRSTRSCWLVNCRSGSAHRCRRR